MNNNQSVRTAFEHYIIHELNQTLSGTINGDYFDDDLQAKWKLWQAARESQPEKQNDLSLENDTRATATAGCDELIKKFGERVTEIPIGTYCILKGDSYFHWGRHHQSILYSILDKLSTPPQPEEKL